MSSTIVFDASATLAWLFNESDAGAVAALIDSRALTAPVLWRMEVTNAILVKERGKKLSAGDGIRLLSAVDALPIELSSAITSLSATALAELARPYQLSAYDATYLDLAIRRNLPLCTLDRNLRAAAERAGVPVLP